MSGGAGVLIGNLLGANELEKAREYGGRLSHLSIAIGIVTGGLLMLISPAIVHFAPLSDTAAEYLQYMLLFCGLNLMAQSVNTTVLDGIFVPEAMRNLICRETSALCGAFLYRLAFLPHSG